MSWSRLKAITVVVLALVLPVLAWPAHAAPPPAPLSYEQSQAEHDAVVARVKALLDKGDFAALNAMARDFRSTNARFGDGERKDEAIYGSVQLFPEEQSCEPCWRYLDDLTKRWIAATPQSSVPYIVRANLLLSRAHGYRGTGPAGEVPPAVWPLIIKIMKEINEMLASKRDIVKADPYYYSIRLGLAPFGATQSEVGRALAEGVAAFPDFGPLYTTAAIYVLPPWGGSYAALDRLARLAAKNTAATDKTGMFYRVYREIHDVHYFGFVVDADGVNRPMLLQAMRDTAGQYPTDNNYAEFIYMACRIGYDGEARHYAALMKDKTSPWAKSFQALARDCDSVSPRKGRQTAALSIPPV